VAFQLAPRLNAAGRLETATAALALLQASDEHAARPLAEQLDACNRERQQIERDVLEQARARVLARFDPARDGAIVLGDASWHVGVVGIVAARLVREFYRPTLLLGGDGDCWRGSGRSIDGFDLAASLRACNDLLVRHGGHAMAAGLSLRPDRVELLRVRLSELARASLAPEQFRPRLRLDAIVPLAEMTLERLEELARLEPTGQGNPPVQLAATNLALAAPAQALGKDGRHLKLRLTDGGATAEAVWWDGAAAAQPPARFDLAFAPSINEFNGRRAVQLRVLDWQSGSGSRDRA
jgi:single-stranded-DNA-specific exonuclease